MMREKRKFKVGAIKQFFEVSSSSSSWCPSSARPKKEDEDSPKYSEKSLSIPNSIQKSSYGRKTSQSFLSSPNVNATAENIGIPNANSIWICNNNNNGGNIQKKHQWASDWLSTMIYLFFLGRHTENKEENREGFENNAEWKEKSA